MRAIVFETFGGPDVLHLSEVALPEPGTGPGTCGYLCRRDQSSRCRQSPGGSWAGLHPPVIPGYDASGIIDAVGPGVMLFAPGDEVFYIASVLKNPRGTYAEYQVLPLEEA